MRNIELKYFVTVFNINGRWGDKNGGNSRTWAYFDSLEEAERVVLNNLGDIYEYYYDTALIEPIGPGLYNYAMPGNRYWYRTYKDVDGKLQVTSMGEPDFAKNVCGYGIG